MIHTNIRDICDSIANYAKRTYPKYHTFDYGTFVRITLITALEFEITIECTAEYVDTVKGIPISLNKEFDSYTRSILKVDVHQVPQGYPPNHKLYLPAIKEAIKIVDEISKVFGYLDIYQLVNNE